VSNGPQLEGVILATLPKALFRVQMDTGERITASLSSQAKRVTIKLLPGDRVSVETSPLTPHGAASPVGSDHLAP